MADDKEVNTITTQCYKLLSFENNNEKYRHGQPIINNDSETKEVLGFVYQINDCSIDVVIFDPTGICNTKNRLINLAAAVDADFVARALWDAILEDRTFSEFWQKYFYEA